MQGNWDKTQDLGAKAKQMANGKGIGANGKVNSEPKPY